jgi:hypothetical protein
MNQLAFVNNKATPYKIYTHHILIQVKIPTKAWFLILIMIYVKNNWCVKRQSNGSHTCANISPRRALNLTEAKHDFSTPNNH